MLGLEMEEFWAWTGMPLSYNNIPRSPDTNKASFFRLRNAKQFSFRLYDPEIS